MTVENDNLPGPHVIAEVGGVVDETHVTLGIYGPDLDPSEISSVLGCSPTSAHRRGDTRGSGPPFVQGAWLLAVKGKAPVQPNELVQRLLDRLPTEPAAWEQLVKNYKVRLTLALFIGTWSRGFELAPAIVERLASLGIAVGFSIYADDGEVSV